MRSVLLPSDTLAAFGSFKCAHPVHASRPCSVGKVKVAECASAEKWAIVKDNGYWCIWHHNVNLYPASEASWNSSGSAPVNMMRLTSPYLSERLVEMGKLRVYSRSFVLPCLELSSMTSQDIAAKMVHASAAKVISWSTDG